MADKVIQNIQIEGARICFRIQKDGWNIRWIQLRKDGDDSQAYIQVTVKYGDVPDSTTNIIGDEPF